MKMYRANLKCLSVLGLSRVRNMLGSRIFYLGSGEYEMYDLTESEIDDLKDIGITLNKV